MRSGGGRGERSGGIANRGQDAQHKGTSSSPFKGPGPGGPPCLPGHCPTEDEDQPPPYTPWEFPKGHPRFGKQKIRWHDPSRPSSWVELPDGTRVTHPHVPAEQAASVTLDDVPVSRSVQSVTHPKSEQYTVRVPIMRDILCRLNTCKPNVDLFATQENARCDAWLGAGGMSEDAFVVDWAKLGTIWMNPPYSLLRQAVDKLILSKVVGIVVVPDWRTERWWRKLQPYVHKKYYYAKGKLIFELDGESVGPTRWGVWAYLVDTSLHNGLETMPYDENPIVRSKGSESRYRKRKRGRKVC